MFRCWIRGGNLLFGSVDFKVNYALLPCEEDPAPWKMADFLSETPVQPWLLPIRPSEQLGSDFTRWPATRGARVKG